MPAAVLVPLKDEAEACDVTDVIYDELFKVIRPALSGCMVVDSRWTLVLVKNEAEALLPLVSPDVAGRIRDALAEKA